VQGEVTSWAPGQVELRVFQGAHASLSGKRLRIRTGVAQAITVGRFQ
jgi:hypothetical protein